MLVTKIKSNVNVKFDTKNFISKGTQKALILQHRYMDYIEAFVPNLA
jgi:hypothetical protein